MTLKQCGMLTFETTFEQHLRKAPIVNVKQGLQHH